MRRQGKAVGCWARQGKAMGCKVRHGEAVARPRDAAGSKGREGKAIEGRAR